ncbi:hypothetical protein P153DRAFT_349728 [Dothidotthia symphoricarpi CBS 119687]|uniref:DUF1989 domain-containing protein n=1 Tax=Dothidotthia symphoricarpi CBS 119687 TaxID=1392245 RepID=A0A6A6A0G5_9PLEO|nr:uncharacterized protein P153DRAFT_349728 [Dothidotthia symphoricarpi CBS 119687]KAF2124643.1 hypothetical protein P153DRAFT_349728 [Dothidotthia symphoricarpi CBS 119687]
MSAHPPTPAYYPTSPPPPPPPPPAPPPRLRTPPPPPLRKTADFLIPPRSGRAWRVPATCLFRLSTPKGPQVGDLNLWNADDPRERFWAARTRQLQGSHVIEGDRLWSVLPFMRPLAGVVEDGCKLGDVGREAGRDARGGVTRWGGRCHDLLGTRCDPYVNNLLTSSTYDFHCHSNLVRAVLPYGLTEFDVHDVLNVFQVTGLTPDPQLSQTPSPSPPQEPSSDPPPPGSQYFMESSPATPSSFLTFFAEQDLLCALSTCPGGDLSVWAWTPEDEAMKKTCRPIRVEVFEIAEEVRAEVLQGWKAPEKNGYRGGHGVGIPIGEGVDT